VSILLAATWGRHPRVASSSIQRGRTIGWDPVPPIHAVDNTLAEADRVTACGLGAAQMYIWSMTFEHTRRSQRCEACQDHLTTAGDRSGAEQAPATAPQ
jgi:hypothetical protein